MIVLLLFFWVELFYLFPNFKFSKALLDAAHDVYDIYRLLHANDIDLNKRAKGNNIYPEPINISENGVPSVFRVHQCLTGVLTKIDVALNGVALITKIKQML